MKLRELFTCYQVLVYPERDGECRTLRVRRILPLLFVLLFFGLAVSFGSMTASALWQHDQRAELHELEKQRMRQRLVIIAKARMLMGLQNDFDRIDDFCNKLLVMADMADMAEPGQDWDNFTGSGGPVVNSMTLSPYDTRKLLRNMQGAVTALNRDVLDGEVLQQIILGKVRKNKHVLDSTPSVWPVKGRVTSGFGMRNHPFDRKYKFHRGIDIVPAGGRGTPIHAPANGVVIFTGWDGGFGLSLIIQHHGNISTRYAHLKSVDVKVGDAVRRDDVIARVGNSGRSTGPHLHYEVMVAGKPQNPQKYILN